MVKSELIQKMEINNEKTCGNPGFTKQDRSTFKYWFAHWCAFNMMALNLHIWRFKYLFHDIEKPWLMLYWGDYSKVQHWHRYNNDHHIEYLYSHELSNFDIDALIIDNECSRLTKIEAPLTAVEFITEELNRSIYKQPLQLYQNGAFIHRSYLAYTKALERAKEIGLN